MPKVHKIKLLENFARDVLEGSKSFEIRENDRGYQTGDFVVFNVCDEHGVPMPRHILNDKIYEITYILSGWGLKDGYVAFGIKETDNE